ncbi:hypothetical protein D3C85_374610 [compost metagenome]
MISRAYFIKGYRYARSDSCHQKVGDSCALRTHTSWFAEPHVVLTNWIQDIEEQYPDHLLMPESMVRL